MAIYPIVVPTPIYYGGGCIGELGLFGTIFCAFLFLGAIGMSSYIGWDAREDKFLVFMAIFIDILLFMALIGLIFDLL